MWHCDQKYCTYVGKGEHSLETHKLLVHSCRKNKGTIKKNRKQRTSVPCTVFGKSERLLVDRVNEQIFASKSGFPLQESLEEEEPKYDPIPLISSSLTNEHENDPSSLEEIVNAFIKLGESSSTVSCNELLVTLERKRDEMKTFLENFKTMEAIREHKFKQDQEKIERRGFKSHEIISDGGITTEIFMRDPIEVLRTQFEHTLIEDIVIDPTDNFTTRTHPMNSEMGVGAARKAIEEIKCSSDPEVFWRNMKVHRSQSIMALLQLYSDKSQTSLSQNNFSFYPVHINFLNFKERVRREHISSGRSIFAYLPVQYNISNDEEIIKNIEVNERKKGNKYVRRVQVLKALHECMNFSLQELKKNAKIGISVQTKDDLNLHAHIMLSSYIADLPEAEDMTGIKRGGNTAHPCHRCLVTKEEMPFSTRATKRNVQHTIELLKKVNLGCNESAEKLKDLSMNEIPPVLFDFPFRELHPCLDTYAIFTVEPMHVLWIGLARTLKECIVNKLCDTLKKSSSICTTKGESRTYSSIKKSVLRMLNDFLAKVQKMSVGYGIVVDFSKGKHEGRLSGLFSDNGLIGMLEASDYKDIENVSPFLGAIVDRCCGEVKEAPVTRTLTMFNDIIQQLYERNHNIGWTDEKLEKLSNDIRLFKKQGRKTFENYQSSKMGFPKWHLLDHIVEDLKRVGNISFLEADFYEMEHKSFKKEYKLTSRRKHSALKEVTDRQNNQLISNLGVEKNHTLRKPNPSRMEAVKIDGAFLVRSGQNTTILQLKLEYRNMYNRRKGIDRGSKVPNVVTEISDRIGELGVRILVELLEKKLSSLGSNSTQYQHQKIQFPSSAYISGYAVPRANNMKSIDNEVYIKKNNLRFSQRVVAASRFYNSSSPRLDNVMIEGSSENAAINEMMIWFAKVLSFVRICKTDNDTETCAIHNRKNCPSCHSDEGAELAFVQYYESLPASALKMDSIDKSLDCVRLQWQRTNGDEHGHLAAKYFDLVPVDTIRGVVHIVPADIEIPLMSTHVKRKGEYDELRNGEEGWASELFYVNRFFKTRGESYQFEDDDLT